MREVKLTICNQKNSYVPWIQANYQIMYWLIKLTFKIEKFFISFGEIAQENDFKIISKKPLKKKKWKKKMYQEN